MKIKYQKLQRPFEFCSPFFGEEFVALIYGNDRQLTPEEQERLSDEIVARGCRYAVCAGLCSASWDESIDMADLKRNDWEVNEANFVMTTWHDDESYDDIAFYFLNHTSFENFLTENFLVVVVGDDSDVLAELRRTIEAQVNSRKI